MATGNQDYLLLRSMAYLLNNKHIETLEGAEMISEINPYNTEAYLLAGKLY